MTNGSANKLVGQPLRYLTKSLVRTALTCPRKLVYASNPKKYPKQDSIREDPFVKHLAEEGKRFGDYCRRLFPHGVEISPCDNYNKCVQDDSLETHSENLVAQTKALLGQQQRRVTLFEGAVRHEHFYIRPDILDRIIHTDSSNKVELRVIEVKTKSYDSRPGSKGGQIWNREKKSIRGNFLPYIQDVAFQSMIARRAFPQYDVTAWLMLPDRSKIRTVDDKNTTCDIPDDVPTVEYTQNAINASTATLLNVDELVKVALTSKPIFPGSYGQSFEKVIQKWAEQFCYSDEKDLSTLFLDVPIGSHCALCDHKYRINDPPVIEASDESSAKPLSGFDICWKHATGLSQNQLEMPLIIDLYGYTKSSIAKFKDLNKFLLDDLSKHDFANKKDVERGDKISSHERQWYQVSTLQNGSVGKAQRVVLMRDIIQREINGWQYPWHFIDFETSSPVLPYYPGMAPYEIFAFQFSHHVIHKYQSHVVHHATEFLHTERDSCPNTQFLRALYHALGSKGTVFQWSPFETTVLKSLLSSNGASSLSLHEKETLSALLVDGSRPMVDLCKLASDYYYVDGSGGSSSIKKLLRPTMIASERLKHLHGRPNYNSNNFKNWQWYQLDENGQVIDPYKLLEMKPGSIDNDEPYIDATSSVTHGGAASTAFHLLQSDGVSQKHRRDIETALLRYCELDTLSMAMIVQAWQGFIENEDVK
jgi:hypothetical protein